ncbi:MAG: hypothetical protein ACOYOS_11145 [Syntrophales bacterium]
MKFSIKTLFVVTGILTVVAMPLSAATAATPTPASAECKICVTKCVMEDGKWFRECVIPYQGATAGVCDVLCAGADRRTLRKELRDAAGIKCDADRETCLTKAGNDSWEKNGCEAACSACKSRREGFLH